MDIMITIDGLQKKSHMIKHCKIDKKEDLDDLPPLESDEDVKEGTIFTPSKLLAKLTVLLLQTNTGIIHAN